MALSAGSVEIRLFAELARLQSDMKKANKVVEDAMGGIQKTVRATTSIFNSMAAAFSGAQIIKLADDYKRFDAQLKLSTKSLNEYNEAYKNVIRIGRTAQSDIGAIGVLYARLNNNLRDFNVTQSQVADVTETISLALRTNNATVQETNSVMLQLSQSFGSGKLNGQEFLAVAEGAPMLLRQLAASLKVPYGALKDLSAQGLITRDALLKAWSDPAYIAGLREQVKEVGTVTSAITVLMNNLKQYIGESDKSTSATKTLSAGIMLVADSINYLVSGALAYGAVALVKWSQSQYAALAASQAASAQKVIAAKVELSLAQAAYASGAAITRQTAAMANNAAATTLATSNTARLIAAQRGLAAATSTTAAAARGFGLVLSAFGGWIGLAITGVILFADKLLALYDRVRGLTPELKALNDEMERRNRLENIGVNAASKSAEQEEALVGQVKLYNEINAQIVRQKSLIDSRKGFGLNVDKETKALGELEKRLRAQSALMGTNLNQANALTPAINENADAFGKLSEKLQTAKELAAEYSRNQALIIIEGSKLGLSQSEIAVKLALLKDQYDKATGATKASKQATKEASAAEKERAEGIKQLVLEQKAFVEAQEDARQAVILDAAQENQALATQIEKAQERIDLLNMGEEAQNRMVEARLQDAIATAEQNVQQAINNGATQDAIKYAEDYLFALKERLDLQKKLTKIESEEERIKAIKAVEKARVEETKRANKEIEDANDRLYKNLARSITDSIVRGFESGLSSVDNFKKAITTAFKSFFVNIGVNFVQQGLQGLFGGLTGRLFAGAGGTLASGEAMAGEGSFGGTLMEGLSSLNTNVVGSIEKLGAFLSTGNGGLGDTIGGFMGQYASTIANTLSFMPAAMSLLKGDVKSTVFQGAGAGIGIALGGPIGGAIGSFLGGAVGGLFGGGTPKLPRYTSVVNSTYKNGQFSSDNVNMGNSNAVGLVPGAGDSLTALNSAFTGMLGGLLEAAGKQAEIVVGSVIYKKNNTIGRFNSTTNGVTNDLFIEGGADVGATFQKLIDTALSETLVKSIQSSSLDESIKRLFDNMADKTQVANMVTASIGLYKANQALVDSFNITAEQTAKVAMVSGQTGDELIKVISAMVEAAGASRTIGEALFELRNTLKDSLGGTMYDSLAEFDNALKAVDKTTQEGIETFYDLFSLRGSFAQFTNSIDALKSGVNSAIFDSMSPAQQQLKRQEDLAKLFTAFDMAIPASVQELIAIGEAIDYTTKAGIDLAAAFPSLVTAFNETRTSATALMESLTSDKFKTAFEFSRAQAYVQNGIPLSNIPSYDVGTAYVPNDGLAMLHQGERVLTREENRSFGNNSEVVAELRALREDNQNMRRELQSIAISNAKSYTILNRLEGDGFIIRDVGNDGLPQIVKVEVV